MVDISGKLSEIEKMIETGQYFIINRPRQYGKTTSMYALERMLKDKYHMIQTSFEGIGDSAFESEESFCGVFLELLGEGVKFNSEELADYLIQRSKDTMTFKQLSGAITDFIEKCDKDVVLMIDEVDKSSNSQLFLSFLGMLRTKYLSTAQGKDHTFLSVILAGVHDIKNLKLKIRTDSEKKLNSPWNIAADYNVEMSFSAREIGTMLEDYQNSTGISMDIRFISGCIYKYTSGYPFLVSAICKLIDERLDKDWTENGIQRAVNILVNGKNTLFDDVIKNLQNMSELYNTVYRIVIKGESFDRNTYADEYGLMYGILNEDGKGKLKVHNEIFEILIYNYMTAVRDREKGVLLTYKYRTDFVDSEGNLDIETILLKFQELMKAEYRDRDAEFIEREGRLLFLAFLKPIINGTGFYFVEPQTRQDNRMDVVVTYNRVKYIIELKIWRGQKYEEKGLHKLSEYLDSQGEQKGYMVVFNFNKDREYTGMWTDVDGKSVFVVMV